MHYFFCPLNQFYCKYFASVYFTEDDSGEFSLLENVIDAEKRSFKEYRYESDRIHQA